MYYCGLSLPALDKVGEISLTFTSCNIYDATSFNPVIVNTVKKWANLQNG